MVQGTNRGQEIADAFLIAAAPDLFEALSEMLEVRFDATDTPTSRRARAALAKAKGDAA